MMTIDDPTIFDWNWPEGLRFLVMKLQHETPPEIANRRENWLSPFI